MNEPLKETSEELLEQFEPFEDENKIIAEQIKSHNLPVILYGAAEMARRVTELMKKFDVPIAGYSVDAPYHHDDMTFLDLPVYNYDELKLQPDKYVFVLAFLGKNGEAEQKFLNNKNLLMYRFRIYRPKPLNYDFIATYAATLKDSYNFLQHLKNINAVS